MVSVIGNYGLLRRAGYSPTMALEGPDAEEAARRMRPLLARKPPREPLVPSMPKQTPQQRMLDESIRKYGEWSRRMQRGA